MRVPHPFPYQGSKRHLAGSILRFFPSDIETLYEPFAGSAAVTIAAACDCLANKFILNDFNQPLIDLWNQIIYQPASISSAYTKLWNEQDGQERDYYKLVRDQFNRTKRPDCLLYLLARCVKASIRYNSNGEFNQSPDNRRKGMHPETMSSHISSVSSLLSGRTVCVSMDYKDALEDASRLDLVYLDPPYQGVSTNRDARYLERVIFDDFVSALDALNHRQISFIVSYDGRTGDKVFGQILPEFLNLHLVELHAGRSTQSTLLGRDDDTYESLYVSPALSERLKNTAPRTLFPAADMWEMGASV